MDPVRYHKEQHGIRLNEIDEDALKVIYRLHNHGHTAYLVGGGVRDLLLKKRPKDYDIATDATPRQIKGLFRNGFIIGRRFKLVHVRFQDGKVIEVSTFRKESSQEETDGPLAEDNSYGNEVTDAYRRDITFNGLFFDPVTQTVIDYVNGFNDLNDRIVRVIGAPDTRFSEDPVRMLRVCRHAVRSGSRLEEAVFQSISQSKEKIHQSAPVRVFEEIRKDLTSGYALGTLSLLAETKLLPILFPPLSLKNFAPLSALVESLERIDTHFHAGEDFPFAIVCGALILLVCQRQESSQHELVLTPFASEEEIADTISAFFANLPLTKRDRERISALLSIWSFFESSSDISAKQVRSFRHTVREDLALLIKVLPFRSRDREVLALLRESAKPPRRNSRNNRTHNNRRPKADAQNPREERSQ
jgi:poly(A) polymerase